jgi:hypothetical protein
VAFNWADFAINLIALAVVPGCVALIGGIVSAEGITDLRRRRRIKSWFWGLFVAGVAMTAIQQYRLIMADQGRPDFVAQFKKEFPWFREPQLTPNQSDANAKQTNHRPVDSKGKQVANLSGLPTFVLVDMLQAQAKKIREDWKAYWEDEDLPLAKQQDLLLISGNSDEKAKADVARLKQQRSSLRAFYDDEFTGRAREAAPLVIEATKRVSAKTKDDQNMRVILQGVVSNSLPYEIGSGQLPEYLDDLAKRLSATN